MKALLKTGETIEIIPNDDFCAAKYINKETSEYVFNDEIVEIINEELEKPMIFDSELEEEIKKEMAKLPFFIRGKDQIAFARHFAKWGAEHLKK